MKLVSTPLSKLHTFSLSQLGNVDVFVVTEKIQLAELFSSHAIDDVLILGGGSNTIFVEPYQGIVVKNDIQGICVEELDEAHRLVVGAGVGWHFLVKWTLQQGMSGLENLALIPGTVGAAPIQNIGAYGLEIERFCTAVHYFDVEELAFKTISAKDCEFGYRDSIFKQQLHRRAIITQIELELPKQWQPELSYGPLQKLTGASAEQIFNKVIEIRRAKLPDPEVNGNAGSFFKNPLISEQQYQSLLVKYPDLPSFSVGKSERKIPAAWLIDQSGLKGRCEGAIQCNLNQPLVLMNLGQGTAEQLIRLAKHIVATVENNFQIKLIPEVRLVGKHGEMQLDEL